MINPQKIRRALVRLAEYKQREHYTPIAVRSIIQNFENHPLRDAILYFCDDDPKEYSARLSELRSVCRNADACKKLTEKTGFDVSNIIRGDALITDNTWMTLRKHFEEVEQWKR